MVEYPSLEEIEELTTRDHYSNQALAKRRFKPYSYAMGLRKTMDYVGPDEIQELIANREFGIDAESIPEVLNSSVSHYVDGKNTQGRNFEITYDRASHGPFDWAEILELLGDPSTVYDVPVRRLVIRFDDEDFVSDWISYISEAIGLDKVPTDWIEAPFFAVLESAEPGEAEAREGIRRMHEDFYFDPDTKANQDKGGLPCPMVTLDLEAVWSYRAFVGNDDPVLTNWAGNEDWTPQKIEGALMNYFAPESRYSGRLYNSSFAGDWRRTFSLEATSTKVFEWEEDEEWEQQPDADENL